jgi:DNA ligase-1
MEYSLLANTYEKLESVSSKLKKTDILANLFSKTSSEELPRIVLLAQGTVFPKYAGLELGIAIRMMIKAISRATGLKPKEIEEKFKKTGDLGLATEECIKKKKQVTLLKKKLNVERIFSNLQKLASISGPGSQERKLNLIVELLVSVRPKETRYVVRTILEELRIGVAEGIIRDAIVKAFLFKEKMGKEKKKEITGVVEHAWNILSDFGEVAKIAKKDGIRGLKKIKVQLGRPIHMMLGEKAESIEDVIKNFGRIAVEFKYDGMRAQIHKKDNKIWVFTRRLENITTQFPDLVELCKENLKTRECIVEGELWGLDRKTQFPLPFQKLSQRIHRKYDIEKMAKEIPIQMNLFDVIYLDGKMLFDRKFKERRKILEKITKEVPGKFKLADQVITDDVKKAKKFYKKALDLRQEGVFLKLLNSAYVFGRHVGGWYKIKPIMETLDLVIIGAEWGTGKRVNWLSSYILACRDPDTGKFLPCGMMGTGLTEKQFEEMTNVLKELVIAEKGKKVELKPKIVVEVAYQEIQKSPHYDSGYALRFPRLQKTREDKSPDEADTIDRVRELFKFQGRKG